jgi:putative flippase GtrA
VAGFIVDAGLVSALTGLGLDAFSARAVSITLAMVTTWRLNRALTFGASGAGSVREGGRYAAVALGVAGINYAVYSALMLAVPGILPWLATAAATGVGMVASYLGYSRWAFGSGRG